MVCNWSQLNATQQIELDVVQVPPKECEIDGQYVSSTRNHLWHKFIWEEGLMTCTAAHHQGAIERLWLHFMVVHLFIQSMISPDSTRQAVQTQFLFFCCFKNFKSDSASGVCCKWECCNIVSLWHSGNVLWTKKVHLDFPLAQDRVHNDWVVIFVWIITLKLAVWLFCIHALVNLYPLLHN